MEAGGSGPLVSRCKTIEFLGQFSALGPLCWPPASLYMRLVGPWRSLVSASVWGAEGREFESRRPDHSENAHPFAGMGVSFCRKDLP
jgi:hypothetical protein